MAENILTSINVSQTVGVMGDVLLYTLLVLVVAGAVYLAYYLTTFKNTLIIRDTAHGRKIIKRYRWKEKRTKNNNIWLITPFNKIKKPLPPSEAVELTPKGKKWVEAWRGEDTETLIYCKDSFNYTTYREENPDFQPLTTQERELLINEVAKSKDYQKKTVLDVVVTVTMFMAPIILIAIIGLTLGDITDALNSYSAPITNGLNTASDAFVKASENLAGIQTPEEIITTEVPN